jgi:isopropylmalate/homocitrate/citramalate synthase
MVSWGKSGLAKARIALEKRGVTAREEEEAFNEVAKRIKVLGEKKKNFDVKAGSIRQLLYEYHGALLASFNEFSQAGNAYREEARRRLARRIKACEDLSTELKSALEDFHREYSEGLE